ncbi:MAG: (Fe-S)-binding protein [Bdellovibrionales bacterium CG10_big_fil_rev_8_21_14_0_10_45_34]|nr:MAG: (Fe-S)-binding protein [Bdellovibrionales bacterium CG10_big_fil_rev_8_21_14_0_10_45_34]
MLSSEICGDKYSLQALEDAQEQAWTLLHKLSSNLCAGLRESEFRIYVIDTILRETGRKSWHPPQVRFGPNTSLGFNEPAKEDWVLKENDIAFIDIGPIYHDHEADVGATITIGDSPIFRKIVSDCSEVFQLTHKAWANDKLSGAKLYEFAQSQAHERGWALGDRGARGHRIGDFPHSIHHRGRLVDVVDTPSAHRWILEIQLKSPDLSFGAFYEDMLK